MKLIIITEGSQKNGLGHLSRVKSFILNLKNEKDVEIKAIAMINDDLKNIFNEIIAEVYFTKKNSEIIDLIIMFNPDFIIFDLLQIDNILFERIKSLKKQIVSISPIFSHITQVDLLFTRGKSLALEGPKIYSGVDYIIIGNHVKQIREEIFKSNLESQQLPIAITMGGTDAPNKSFNILETLVKFNRSLLIWVLLGEGYAHSYTELVNVIKQNPLHEIILARTNKSMWKILENTVLAIASGGLTAYEAAFAGLPTINILDQQKHEALLSDLIDSGATINLGPISELKSETILNVINQIYLNREKLLQMRLNGKQLNIGMGAFKILDVLRKHQV